MDAEYNSGLAFCYKCIIFVFKKEYTELNISKLEVGVQKYMAKGDKNQGDQDQTKAPSSGEQKKEAMDPVLGAGQGLTPAPPEVASPSLSEIADPSSTEAVELHNP